VAGGEEGEGEQEKEEKEHIQGRLGGTSRKGEGENR
jgi:hypothetical protein